MTNSPVPIGNYSAPSVVLPASPIIGTKRACPDCGRPQHYTGTEHGWAHDAAFATLACGASPALLAELEK